jgi:hypothetical protein
VSITAAAAPAIEPVLQVHLWRWRLIRRELRGQDEEEEEEPEAEPPTWNALTRGYARLERWLDPPDLALFLAGEHRRAQLDRLQVHLAYSFRDIALTGKTFAALCVLGGVLPPRIALTQRPSWEATDRARADIGGRITIWPGRFVFDLVVYALKNIRIRKPVRQGEAHGQ